MALTYLLDENIPGRLDRAIQRHNVRGLFLIDFTRVGIPEDLPLGSDDPTILLWAERRGRILLSLDEHTLPGHVANHLRAGCHIPGLFMIRPSAPLLDVVE